MKNLIIALIFCMIVFTAFAMASTIPQVIFTSFNLTISGNCTAVVYTIHGEGLNANDVVATNYLGQDLGNSTFANCSSANFNYTKVDIPITFSRTIETNDTDMAVLIHSLATNNNFSSMWIDCVQNLTDVKNNCLAQTNALNTIINTDLATSTKKDNTINTLTTHRWILGIIAVGAGIAAIVYYRKSVVKTTKSPLVRFPSTG